MSTRKIAESTLWQMASQFGMAALSILTVKFVAIGLTKELAGYYNSSYGYLQVFGILADFGLYAIAVREVARAKNRAEVLGGLIILRCIILFLSLSLALALAWILPMWRGTPLPLGVTIAAFVPFFTLLAGILRTVFQVHYKMHYVFIAEVTHRAITTGLIGLFILWGIRQTSDVRIMYAFLAIGGIGAFTLYLLSMFFGNRLQRIRPRWDSALLGRLARTAAPYGLAFLCMALYRQFDVTLIALLRSDFELQNAYYGFVLRMTDMAFLIPTFLLNSVLPTLSQSHEKGEETRSMLGKTFLLLLVLGSISSLFSYFWARPLIALLTTEQYLSTPTQAGSDIALQLLSAPIFLNGIVLYSFYVLLTRHAWRRLVLLLGAGAFLSVGLNLLLIPDYGFLGACLTSIFVHGVLALTLLPASQKVLPLMLSLADVLRWIAFTILLGALLALSAPLLTDSLRTIIGLGLAGGAILGLAEILKIRRAVGF
ncbi:oligosaccharide flippase family protein [Candidatus Peregrinibacteria bacterium]|nr:oligosaccharide flippase family protein [Candidatus Peregrinibacteria bacterium]